MTQVKATPDVGAACRMRGAFKPRRRVVRLNERSSGNRRIFRGRAYGRRSGRV